MSRMFVVAALAAACLMGFGACGLAQAESSVKSSKHSQKTKAGSQGQSVGTTTDRGSGSNAGGRTDSEYGQSAPKGR